MKAPWLAGSALAAAALALHVPAAAGSMDGDAGGDLPRSAPSALLRTVGTPIPMPHVRPTTPGPVPMPQAEIPGPGPVPMPRVLPPPGTLVPTPLLPSSLPRGR